MCDWEEISRSLIEEMEFSKPENYFNSNLITKFPYSRVKQGHCLCGTQLDPAKLTQPLPHFLCSRCYQKLVSLNLKTDRCLICGNILTSHQIQQKRRYTRELQFRFCEGSGKCLEYFTFFAAIILGIYDPNRASSETSVFESVFGMNNSLSMPAPKLLEAEHTGVIRFSDWADGFGSSTQNSQDEISLEAIEKLLEPIDEPVKVPVPKKPQRPKRKRITLPENGKTYDVIDI